MKVLIVILFICLQTSSASEKITCWGKFFKGDYEWCSLGEYENDQILDNQRVYVYKRKKVVTCDISEKYLTFKTFDNVFHPWTFHIETITTPEFVGISIPHPHNDYGFRINMDESNRLYYANELFEIVYLNASCVE